MGFSLLTWEGDRQRHGVPSSPCSTWGLEAGPRPRAWPWRLEGPTPGWTLATVSVGRRRGASSTPCSAVCKALVSQPFFPSFVALPAVQSSCPRDTQEHQRATAPPAWQPCTPASWAVGDACGPSCGQPGPWLRAHSLRVQSSARIGGLSPEAWWVGFCFFCFELWQKTHNIRFIIFAFLRVVQQCQGRSH